MSSECICVALRAAARKVTSVYDDALAPVGITVGQFSMLRRIAHADAVSLTELGRLSDLDRSTVGRNARVLERLGLVRAVPGHDQREAMLSLTEHGERALEQGAPLWEQAQHSIEAALGEDGTARLRALLGVL